MPAKPAKKKALSIYSTPENRALAERLRRRHGMSFTEIVWTLAEALDGGLISLDSGGGPRVKATVRTQAPSP